MPVLLMPYEGLLSQCPRAMAKLAVEDTNQHAARLCTIGVIHHKPESYVVLHPLDPASSPCPVPISTMQPEVSAFKPARRCPVYWALPLQAEVNILRITQEAWLEQVDLGARLTLQK